MKARTRSIVLALLLVLVLGGLTALWAGWHEYAAYNLDIATCRSDNLFVVKRGLEEYVECHDGRLPSSSQELRRFITERKGFDYYSCHLAKEAFLWRSDGAGTEDGSPVIVMCPWGSHGFLRKFSWGIIQDGARFKFVKVLADGKVVFEQAHDK